MKKTNDNPNKKQTSDTVSEEDKLLFRYTIGDVTKIKTEQHNIEKNKPEPVPKQSMLDSKDVIKQLNDDPFLIEEVERGDELNFHRPGIQKQTLRKLRRGQFVIEAELDLHGFTTSTAKPVLVDFLNRSVAKGQLCVRIIHGKGHGSKNKLPILKNKLNQWLQKREEVLAFCSARANDGGTGAAYVLLKTKKSFI